MSFLEILGMVVMALGLLLFSEDSINMINGWKKK